MQLEYRKIFKQAYEIVKNNKFLWIFGLFLVWGNLLNFSYVSQNQQSSSSLPVPTDLIIFKNHPFLGNFILLLILFLVFQLILLFFRARAANIIAVKAILEKQETSFIKALRVGGLFNLRLLGVTVLMQILLLVLAFLIVSPIFYLFSLKFFIRAIILSILGLIIFIPVSIVTTLINFLSPMFVTMYDFKIGEAIKRSFELISQSWPTLLVFSFLLLCLMILSVILSLLLAGLAVSPFVLLAYLAYHRGGSTVGLGLTIFSIVFGSIVFFVTQAVVAVFQQTAWILAFLQLIKPQIFEQEEVLPAPEIVS